MAGASGSNIEAISVVVVKPNEWVVGSKRHGEVPATVLGEIVRVIA